MSVSCPACGSTTFRAAYRVAVLHEVALRRCPDSREILIGHPGACVDQAPAPTYRDFDALRCAGCSARLDWEIDHRSLYVLASD